LDELVIGKLNEGTAESYMPFNLTDDLRDSLKMGEDISKVARSLN